MNEDHLFSRHDSSSSAASSCATTDPRECAINVSPQDFKFFCSFEHEKDVTQDVLLVMNMSSIPVSFTVSCSHPALVNVEALDEVVVEAQCKVKCRVYQHPVTKQSNLAVLQLVAFSKKEKCIIREHFIPVYINCRPSQKTRARFLGLKKKLQHYLKNSAFISADGKLESLGRRYKKDLSSMLATSSDQDLFTPLVPRHRLAVSESSNLSLDRRLRCPEAGRDSQLLENVSRSIPTSLHEDAADSLIRHREFLSSKRTKSSSLLGYATTSTESSSTPSSSNVTSKKPTAPRKISPPLHVTHSVSLSQQAPPSPPEIPDRTVARRPSDVMRPVITSDHRIEHPAAQETVISRKTSTVRRTTAHHPDSYDNDVLLCYCVVLFSAVHALYSWWCGELQVLYVFSLSDSELKHLLVFILSLLSTGYLIGAHFRS
ncbi:uncharacterized protein LOC108670513 [Hyalella azteca]|uniref:Uncharacterized protein LOC108670513 n=1 Tax=Hyalella azteca TaxID=294128 RepID=A0A8B7NJJ0_HYAAZ|nr:uncharacterized protein LOC108670513 [Hyalella azteca]